MGCAASHSTAATLGAGAVHPINPNLLHAVASSLIAAAVNGVDSAGLPDELSF